MGVLTPLSEAIQSRCLIYYRAAPEAVSSVLPEGLEPAVYRGFTMVGLCWTRVLGIPGRWLSKHLAPTSDELAYCFSVASRRPDARHRVWVQHRETNSRFSAHWASRVLGGEYQLAEFRVEETPWRLALDVENGGRRELTLRAESSAEFLGSVFLSAREVEDWLQHSGSTQPRSPLVPSAPDLSVAGGRWTIDPLAVFELRCPFFEDPGRFPPGTLQLDSAFRMVRSRPAREGREASASDAELRDVALRSTAPYVPI
jgi:hypothetical protein